MQITLIKTISTTSIQHQLVHQHQVSTINYQNMINWSTMTPSASNDFQHQQQQEQHSQRTVRLAYVQVSLFNYLRFLDLLLDKTHQQTEKQQTLQRTKTAESGWMPSNENTPQLLLMNQTHNKLNRTMPAKTKQHKDLKFKYLWWNMRLNPCKSRLKK